MNLGGRLKFECSLVAVLVASLGAGVANAAYTRANSNPVYIVSIYANEAGSPFLTFTPVVSSTCAGMYLYDITSSGGDPNLRANKMAVALAAKASGKQVILDYYADPNISGWSACFISGITIVD